MTIATDLGFKIGEMYRVVGKGNINPYYKEDMIVEFTTDDGTSIPWFTYISGPVGDFRTDGDVIAVNLSHLSPVEQIKPSINKSLLLLYIRQQYPDDKMLKALISAL